METRGEGGRQSLVIHIRSGDIFGRDRNFDKYGQVHSVVFARCTVVLKAVLDECASSLALLETRSLVDGSHLGGELTA